MNARHTLTFFALILVGAAQASPSPFVEGAAYDKDSGELLYREHHLCARDLKQCTVRYKDTDGALIARKELDYRHAVTAPALVLNDYRHDRVIRIPFTDDSGDLVVDAGFDNFVRAQWDTLASGELVTFRFRGVGFDSPIDMKIGLSDEGVCDRDALCLAVNIDSWLLSKFVEPIQLTYSRDDRRLQRYSGISNLKGAGGESMTVDIIYEYPNTGTQAASGDDIVLNLTAQP